MKVCPKCKSTYSDKTLRFCLTDGTSLEEFDAEKTQEMNVGDKNALQIDISPQEKQTAAYSDARTTQGTFHNQSPPVKKGVSPLIVGLLSAVLLVVSVGFAGFVIYTFTENQEAPEKNTNLANDSNGNNAVNELKDEIANLRERINSRQTKDDVKISTPNDSAKSKFENSSVLINSPNDGFLALRSAPNHKTGTILAKIPHAATIVIGSCQNQKVKIGKNSGHWCRTTYNGVNGWIFDAFVN